MIGLIFFYFSLSNQTLHKIRDVGIWLKRSHLDFDKSRPIIFELPGNQMEEYQIYYTNVLSLQIIMQSRKGWTEIQDDRLLKIIKKYGDKNWTLISQKLSLGSTQDRTGKQCRQRWHNNLNPNISNKEWTSQEDHVLFQAHSRHGSKWKQISKLFEGRTDNSIKNHFYSTVRSCLRRISNLKGQRHSGIFMKSIKPFVLSKIVQNTELTNLILSIGRNKSKSSSQLLEVDDRTVNHINEQLRRISIEYQQQNSKNKVKDQSEHSNHSIESFPKYQKAEENKQHSNSVRKQSSSSFMYLEDFQEDSIQQNDGPVDQTYQQQKKTIQSRFTHFKSFEEQSHKQTAHKQIHLEQGRQQIWVQQNAQNDFFDQPQYRKDRLPYPKLQSKISKNSQFQGHLDAQQRNKRNLVQQGEQIGIEFDLEELLNSD